MDIVVDNFPIFALGQDFADTAMDWGAWGATSAEGDLDFANDPGKIVRNFLAFISAVGTFTFCVDLVIYCRTGKINKNIWIFRFGCEDFAQVMIYSFVAQSQVAKEQGSNSTGALFGVIQALGFVFLKLMEVFIVLVKRSNAVHP